MKKNKKTLIAAIPLFLIVILVFAGFGVWKKYRDTLMQNQEEQMLLTTRILSENMAMSAEEYEESLSFLAKTAENRPQDEAKQLYREFIDTQTSFIESVPGRRTGKAFRECQGCTDCKFTAAHSKLGKE